MTVDAAEDDPVGAFRWFLADPHYSTFPMCKAMCQAVIEEPELTAIFVAAPPEKRRTTDFSSAVQLQIMRHPDEPLAAYFYMLAGNQTRPVDSEFRPMLLDFVRRHYDDVTGTINTVHVQTNEPARCIALYPALRVVAGLTDSRKINLVEVGSGPGLTMIPGEYSYDYGAGKVGSRRSRVHLQANLSGPLRPFFDSLEPTISAVGIDPHATSLNDPAQLEWSLACLYPDNPARIDRFRAAVPLVTGPNTPRIIEGDANDMLVPTIREYVNAGTVCVMTSFMQMYYSAAQRTDFVRQLSLAAELRAGQGERGEIWWVLHDWPQNIPTPAQDSLLQMAGGRALLDGQGYAPVTIAQINASGIVRHIPLAVAEAYGSKLDWINPDFGKERAIAHIGGMRGTKNPPHPHASGRQLTSPQLPPRRPPPTRPGVQ